MYEVEISSVTDYVKHIEYVQQYRGYWFRGVANAKYLPLPGIIWKKARNAEGSLVHQFLVSYKSYIGNQELNSWEILALMQHHGLPTRLLDWSESALVALFFALSAEPNSIDVRAVWVLDPYHLNSETIGLDRTYCPAVIKDKNIKIKNNKILNLDAYLPPNLSPNVELPMPETPLAIISTRHLKRVSSQKGCFTIHGSGDKSIHEYIKNDNAFYMIKLNISNEQRLQMLNTLATLGIDEEFIYQDMDSLCNKLNRNYVSYNNFLE